MSYQLLKDGQIVDKAENAVDLKIKLMNVVLSKGGKVSKTGWSGYHENEEGGEIVRWLIREVDDAR
jgi:hypothetical protein